MGGAWRHTVGHTAYALEDTRGTRRITQKSGGGLMGERMRDARKVTRPHARMDIGGEHMDGAWRNTAGWKLGGVTWMVHGDTQ